MVGAEPTTKQGVGEYDKRSLIRKVETMELFRGDHSSSGVRNGQRDQGQGEQPKDGDDLRSEVTGPGSLENSQEESKIMLTTVTAATNTHPTHFRRARHSSQHFLTYLLI